MIIINKTNKTKYSTLAHRDVLPGTQSADMDMAGFTNALSELVNSCGSVFCIRFNKTERELINRLLTLDDIGRVTKVVSHPNQPSPLELLMRKERIEKAQKIAAIKAAQHKEELIRSEATYTSQADVSEARAKAKAIRREIAAKKLEKDAGNVSLSDLIGDNKFIEESMKHSNIATAVASEEGWDMEKMNAPKVRDTQAVPEPAELAEAQAEAVPEPAELAEAPAEAVPETSKTEAPAKTKKRAGRSRKENK